MGAEIPVAAAPRGPDFRLYKAAHDEWLQYGPLSPTTEPQALAERRRLADSLSGSTDLPGSLRAFIAARMRDDEDSVDDVLSGALHELIWQGTSTNPTPRLFRQVPADGSNLYARIAAKCASQRVRDFFRSRKHARENRERLVKDSDSDSLFGRDRKDKLHPIRVPEDEQEDETDYRRYGVVEEQLANRILDRASVCVNKLVDPPPVDRRAVNNHKFVVAIYYFLLDKAKGGTENTIEDICRMFGKSRRQAGRKRQFLAEHLLRCLRSQIDELPESERGLWVGASQLLIRNLVLDKRSRAT